MTGKQAPLKSFMENYLRAISQFPLLTEEEEVMLAKKIEKGRKATQALARRLKGAKQGKENVNDGEVAKLQAFIRDGEQSRGKMVSSNLGLAVAMAKRYAHIFALPDLIQAGNIGLLSAVDSFNWREGCRFSTHAFWQIFKEVMNVIKSQVKTIRVSQWMAIRIPLLKQAVQELYSQGCERPSAELIAKQMNLSIDEVEEIKRALVIVSRYKEDEPKLLASLPSRENDALPDEKLDKAHLERRVKAVLAMLDPRERKVIEMRFGFYNKPPSSFNQIGRALGKSREEARKMCVRLINRFSIGRIKMFARLKEFV